LRDPLFWIPVRYKLPLTFAFLCLVAFGLGGYVVTTTARESLRTQIQLRLNEHATSLNLVVDKSLELLGRRVEDFASDGFIRLQLERLTMDRIAGVTGGSPGGEEESTAARDALARHLRVNKLPLVGEFIDALVLDAEGQVVLRAHAAEGSPPPSFHRDALWVGPLAGPSRLHPFPTFILSTPVDSIQGEERLGFLQIVVRADVWAGNLKDALAFPGAQGFSARLSTPGGYALSLVPGEVAELPAGSDTGDEQIRFTSTVARTGWQLDLAVDRGVLTIPMDEMVLTFFYLGVVLVALTFGLLLFPQQFLLKPLSALQDAARRIAEGDFSSRRGWSATRRTRWVISPGRSISWPPPWRSAPGSSSRAPRSSSGGRRTSASRAIG